MAEIKHKKNSLRSFINNEDDDETTKMKTTKMKTTKMKTTIIKTPSDERFQLQVMNQLHNNFPHVIKRA